VEQYQRYYCHDCKEYVPKAEAAASNEPPPNPGGNPGSGEEIWEVS
jgi:hypothetical protein